MKWKCCLASLGVLLVLFIAGAAQSNRVGRVEIVMPQTAPELPGFSPEVEKFTIYAISGNKKYKLNRSSLESYSGPNYIHVARYQKELPPGRYSLSIKDNEDYLLPSFLLEAGETYTINVPIARLPLSGYACVGGIFLGDRENDPNGKPVKAEIYKTGGPFDIAIHFCASEQRGDTIVYKPARIYYKEFYVDADVIEIDRLARTITATTSTNFGVVVLKNGAFSANPSRTFPINF